MAHIYFGFLRALPGGGGGFSTRTSLALKNSNAAKTCAQKASKNEKKKIADASPSQLDVGDRLNTPFSLRGSIIKAVKMTLVSVQGGIFAALRLLFFAAGRGLGKGCSTQRRLSSPRLLMRHCINS